MIKVEVMLSNSAEEDIIGIKEALAALLEAWDDVRGFDVRSYYPEQLKLAKELNARKRLTFAGAIEMLTEAEYDLQELRAICAAAVEITKIREDEDNEQEGRTAGAGLQKVQIPGADCTDAMPERA